jgi:fructokinase
LFIIAGEALIDFISTKDGSYRPIAGGAPFNFARALALQGVAAGYANPISSDHFGAALRDSLRAAGAKILGAALALPTSLAIVSKSADGQPSYQFYRNGVADRALGLPQLLGYFDAATLGFHSGGLALLPPDHEAILAAQQQARASGILCTLDVNMRMQVASSMSVSPNEYRAAARAVIASADIVKVSDEDLQQLAMTGTPLDAARPLLSDICKLVAVTMGASGAWLLTAADEIFQPSQVVNVVDTVGAGDCFFAGLIASLTRDGALQTFRAQTPSRPDLERALRHATRSAAINITRDGCQPPTWQEVASEKPIQS